MTRASGGPLTLSRRNLLQTTAGTAATIAVAPWLASCAESAAPDSEPEGPKAAPSGDGQAVLEVQPLSVGMLLYPGFTMLDLTGPQAAWGVHGPTHLVWKEVGPVMADSGITLNATTTYRDCPRELDVLFVPGGFGTAEAMLDPEALQFLTERAPHVKYVTAVCSGSLVLAAAGLLDGYRASSHWLALEPLSIFDVEVVRERVVIDRNRITGGGVTAGIDFGLVVLAQLRGQKTAELQQLIMEYAPEPPYDAGDARTVDPEILAVAKKNLEGLSTRTMAAAEKALKRLKASG